MRLFLCIFAVFLMPQLALTAPVSVIDLDGQKRTPLIAANDRPSVLVFITHDCPVANKFAPEIRRIAKDFAGRVQFTVVYADPEMTATDRATHRKDYSYGKLTCVHDRTHRLVAATGVEVTPEAVLTNVQGKVVYRGRINNFYEDFGKARRVITQHDLRAAITALLANRPVPAPRGKAIGCYIPKLKK